LLIFTVQELEIVLDIDTSSCYDGKNKFKDELPLRLGGGVIDFNRAVLKIQRIMKMD